jgi:hypothetical protein
VSLDLRAQEFFRLVTDGNLAGVRAMAQSLAGTGIFPARLGLLGTRNANGQLPEEVAKALAANSPAHQAIHEYLSAERLRMEYFE